MSYTKVSTDIVIAACHNFIEYKTKQYEGMREQIIQEYIKDNKKLIIRRSY